MMKNLPVLTEIEDGQPYVDEPIYVGPAKRLITILAESLAEIYGHVYYIKKKIRKSDTGDAGYRDVTVRKRRDLPEPILVRYNHVKLRWMKPGPDGELIPR